MNFEDNNYQVRNIEELLEAENMFCDFVWFVRHLCRMPRSDLQNMLLSIDPESERIANAAAAIIEKHSNAPLFQHYFIDGHLYVYEEGEINGVLETLR